MNAGYTRKRRYTPTRRRTYTPTRTSRVAKIARRLDLEQKIAKQSKGCLTHSILNTKTVGHADAPKDAFGNHLGTVLGVADNTQLKVTYAQLMPNVWMGFGNLLSCIRQAVPGQVAKEFERGGDEIYLQNMEFHITAENKDDFKDGGRFRFVVWKTNRARDLTTSLAGGWNSGINRHSEMVIDNYPKARFSGPPLLQDDFIGPTKALANVQAKANGDLVPQSNYGTVDQVYPGPLDNAEFANYVVGVNGLDAVVDKSRCTVLCDTYFDMKPATTAEGCCPMAKYSKQVRFNKKISFSTEKTVASITGDPPVIKYVNDVVLDTTNANDYINCAIICVPNGNMSKEASTWSGADMDTDDKPAMANVRIEMISRWRDLNTVRTFSQVE